MRTTSCLSLALCTAALLSGGATAQREEGGERTQDHAAERTREAAREHTQDAEHTRGTHEGKELGPAEARRAAEQKAKEHAGDARKGAAPNHRVIAAEIASAETHHRGRMAKLKRLKVLAEKAKQDGRVKEINDLQHTELRHHEQVLAKLRSKLGREGQAAADRATGHGREAKEKDPAGRRKALEQWEKTHPGRGHGVETHGRATRGAKDARGRAEEAARGHTKEAKDAVRKQTDKKEKREGRDG